jgi:hypothetical protein
MRSPCPGESCYSDEAMTNTTRFPERARFSLLYCRQGPPGVDSERMRRRLGVLIGDREPARLYEMLRAKLGAPVLLNSDSDDRWLRFFEETDLKDVMDTISFAYDAIQAGRTFSTEGYGLKLLRALASLFLLKTPVSYRKTVHRSYRTRVVHVSYKPYNSTKAQKGCVLPPAPISLSGPSFVRGQVISRRKVSLRIVRGSSPFAASVIFAIMSSICFMCALLLGLPPGLPL